MICSGKRFGVGRRPERFFGEHGGSLMVSVPVPVGSGKARNQDIGTKSSNHAHHVAERDIMPAPLLKGFFRIFGIAEIRHPAEALLDSVVTVRCRQLQHAQHAQHVEQIAADLVLAAFAPSQSHQQCGDPVAARFQRQHAAIFIIGVRGRLHQSGRGLQTTQRLFQSSSTGVLRQRIDRAWTSCRRLGGHGRNGPAHHQGQAQRPKHSPELSADVQDSETSIASWVWDGSSRRWAAKFF